MKWAQLRRFSLKMQGIMECHGAKCCQAWHIQLRPKVTEYAESKVNITMLLNYTDNQEAQLCPTESR